MSLNHKCHELITHESRYMSRTHHTWVAYVTFDVIQNESCHTYEWVMSHIWMSHVTQVNESCHTCEWVMSHIWMSHVTHMNESCHIWKEGTSPLNVREWGMSHMHESCYVAVRANVCLEIHEMYHVKWVMSHISMSHATHTNGSCHTYELGM